jgi:uronate dehydrogenase
MKTVLVTGAAGLIGRILMDALAGELDARGLDVVGGRGVEHVVDMTNLGQLAPAFRGASAVVDLAGDASRSVTWERAVRNNIPATLNALEAARLAGATRVVYASSNRVVGLYERDEPYSSVVAGRYGDLDPAAIPKLSSNVAIRPDSAYAVGKACGECAARHYAETYDISVICVRIGTVLHGDRPRSPRHFATLLTRRDLVHLVRCCLSAPRELGFAILYGVSANTWRFWDIEEAGRLVGFAPQGDAERFRR